MQNELQFEHNRERFVPNILRDKVIWNSSRNHLMVCIETNNRFNFRPTFHNMRNSEHVDQARDNVPCATIVCVVVSTPKKARNRKKSTTLCEKHKRGLRLNTMYCPIEWNGLLPKRYIKNTSATDFSELSNTASTVRCEYCTNAWIQECSACIC